VNRKNALGAWRLVIGALVAFLLGGASANAQAKPTTVKRMAACTNVITGEIIVRPRCRGAERNLRVSDLVVGGQSGSQGNQGLAGTPGAVGPMGPKGDQGLTGAQGLAGADGIDGAIGPIGPIGASGPKGDQGLQGAVGATGPQGIKGDQGVAGPQGAIGAQGPVGVVGATGATGQIGPLGPMGPQGAQGAQGPVGPAGYDLIPSGKTVYGVVGADYYSSAANVDWADSASLIGIAPVAFGNELVAVSNSGAVDNECGGATCLSAEEQAHSGACTGSYEAPTAPPGWLCIYPVSANNAKTITGSALPAGSSRTGFVLRWKTVNTGATGFRGAWAYTAP